MKEESCTDSGVKNVFKNGRMPTAEEYTEFWIRMIRQIEALKADHAESP